MMPRNSVTKSSSLKMVSLFAGIGGFELGFSRAGIKSILSCEIDSVAQKVLCDNFPNTKIVSDVCELEALPADTDIVCAGFPCQDISTIGVKTGLSGTRSSLVKEVFRLLKTSSVEWVIFENVSNMLHLRKGEAIKTIVDELNNLGYHWAYRMVDSLAFVPQKRRRVYVVASLHHNPCDILLSDSVEMDYGLVSQNDFIAPLGFYWTEGKYAIGLYQNAIPTLKVGSSIGIPSAPAIAFPNGMIGSPDIRDAERLQGFPVDWTKSAELIAKPSIRWKLVGNAVTVDVVSWIANKILNPREYDANSDIVVNDMHKWASAGWGYDGKRYISSSSSYPLKRLEISLEEFLKFSCCPLSYKAVRGFETRLNAGKVHCPEYFREAVHDYVVKRSNKNE